MSPLDALGFALAAVFTTGSPEAAPVQTAPLPAVMADVTAAAKPATTIVVVQSGKDGLLTLRDGAPPTAWASRWRQVADGR